jgi:hypothetical protein
MTLSLNLLETQRSDIDQLLELIHHFYQHFDYPYIRAISFPREPKDGRFLG